MKARALLTLAGGFGLTLGACEATSRAAADAPAATTTTASAAPARPMLDGDGRPLPGNVVTKGVPPVDAGADR
ncbi:MAG: hypothetical protein U0183_31655 [Polyangiaceae bacterium]